MKPLSVFVILLAAAVVAILARSPFAVAQQPQPIERSVAFEWDANTETDLEWYVVTIKGADGIETKKVPATQTTAVWSPLPAIAPPWIVTVQAVNRFGWASEPSKPLTINTPAAPVGVRVSVSFIVTGKVLMQTDAANQDGHEWRLNP